MASTLPVANDCCNACSGISVTVTTTSSAQNLFVYDTIALLRAASPPTTTTAIAIVKGDVAAYDGLGGDYVWESTSTTADDGINFIKPASIAAASAGRWRKQI